MEGCDGAAQGEHVFAEEAGFCAPSVGRQLTPLWPSSYRATSWHSRLQNHALRHRPQSSSLAWLLPHAWHAFAAGASDAESTPGAVVLGPVVPDTRGAASAAVIVRAPSVGRQLAPEWPCLAAMIWHSRPQNHALRHRPQRSSLHAPLPHASHVIGAIAEAARDAAQSERVYPTKGRSTRRSSEFTAKIPVALTPKHRQGGLGLTPYNEIRPLQMLTLTP